MDENVGIPPLPDGVVFVVTVTECEVRSHEWHVAATGRQDVDKAELAEALRKVADDMEEQARVERARLN